MYGMRYYVLYMYMYTCTLNWLVVLVHHQFSEFMLVFVLLAAEASEPLLFRCCEGEEWCVCVCVCCCCVAAATKKAGGQNSCARATRPLFYYYIVVPTTYGGGGVLVLLSGSLFQNSIRQGLQLFPKANN
jgi:hypothetical protein